MCKEGSVFCRNQFDRSADEATNAQDVLIMDNQLDPVCALARTDYDSPNFIVLFLDQFCKNNGFDELSQQLKNTNYPKISPSELEKLIKGIASVAPLIHKRCVNKQLKEIHATIMDISTEMLKSSLSSEGIKSFVDVSFILSRITGQIYTQRTKQEKIEQFQILLAQATFRHPNDNLHIIGEEFVERLCNYKEVPFRQDFRSNEWISESIANNTIFWKKFENNFAIGFDYSCMTFLHLISLPHAPLIEEKIKKFNKKSVIGVISKLATVPPKNIVNVHLTALTRMLDFYKDDQEIVDAIAIVLWSFINPDYGYPKNIIEEANKAIIGLKKNFDKLISFALQDLKKINFRCNISRVKTHKEQLDSCMM